MYGTNFLIFLKFLWVLFVRTFVCSLMGYKIRIRLWFLFTRHLCSVSQTHCEYRRRWQNPHTGNCHKIHFIMAILKWRYQWRGIVLLYIPSGDEELLSKYMKIGVHLTSILSVFFPKCETRSLTVRDERVLRVSENRVLRVFENRVLRVFENRVLRVFENRVMRVFENRVLRVFENRVLRVF